MDDRIKEIAKEIVSELHPNSEESPLFTRSLEQTISILERELVVYKAPLPCPHCGCKKIRIWESDDGYWNIQCDDDEAVCGSTIYDHESKEAAIEAWNRRCFYL